jgi:hypothetical protein
MTEQPTLTYKRRNKRIRYSERAVRLRSGKMVVKLINLGAGPKLSERPPQAKVLAKAPREVRVAELSPAIRKMLRSAGQARHDWHTLGAEELLARINNPKLTPRDREMAVLFAETTVFNGSLREQLLAELATFIGRNRFTRERNGITAVGSAVRKFAMNMDESHFELYGRWLRPDETERLRSHVELELAKALCWRLSYLPMSAAPACRGLASVLSDVGTAYLSPRWIVEKNYAAVALQAVTAVAILQALSGDRTAIGAMLERVSALGLDWFSELLDDRLQESYEAISRHDAQLAERLRQLIESER